MSVDPSFILQTAIVRGIQAFRKDHRFVDMLFRNLRQKDIQEIRTFIDKQAFDIAINYPRDSLKLPAIVILLKNENEAQAYVGDSMGLEVPDVFSYDGDLEEEIIGGVGSISDLSGEGQLVFGPMDALGGTTNSISFFGQVPIDQFVGRDYTLRIVAGTGAGQIRRIVSNTMDSIVVSPIWTTIPDDTSIFEIRASADEVVGEPSKLYDKRNDTPFIEKRGSLYNVSYQVQVISVNPESTIYLYSILKAIFTLSRIFLEKQGVINMKMSGTDFLPRAEYVPSLAYMRALNLDFVAPFDIYEDIDPLIDSINIFLESGEAVDISSSIDLS